jgi:hypothetical protein
MDLLHRTLLDWEWYQEPNTLRVFLHLLLRANHKSKRWQGVLVKSGQVITGRLKLSQELNLTERKIRTALDHLKMTNEISIKATKQYSIITINNGQNINTEGYETTKKCPTLDHLVTKI